MARGLKTPDRRYKMGLEYKLSNEVLNQSDVELALKYLYHPHSEVIPKKLKNLNELQWMLLSQVLNELLEQKEESTLH